MSDVTTLFADLFEGNRSAYGTEDGGCVRADLPDVLDWLHRVEAHLWGDTPIGVYPHWRDDNGDTVCRWGCVDFDEGDEESFIHATNLRVVLEQFGIVGWVERSRSKGFHVWVFSDGPTPARLMRNALLGATQVAGGPTREVNPKQEKLSVRDDGSVQLGNYVRLPYPHLRPSTRRCMVDDIGAPVGLETFVNQASTSLASTAALRACEAVYQPVTPPRSPEPSEPVLTPSGGLPGLVVKMLEGGPLAGQEDRSAWLWRLCRVMYEKQVPYEDARSVLTAADLQWGKFHERPDGQETLDRMLAKAWGIR